MKYEVYAEWVKNGVFDNGFFHTWDEWHDFSFDPDIEVQLVRKVA